LKRKEKERGGRSLFSDEKNPAFREEKRRPPYEKREAFVLEGGGKRRAAPPSKEPFREWGLIPFPTLMEGGKGGVRHRLGGWKKGEQDTFTKERNCMGRLFGRGTEVISNRSVSIKGRGGGERRSRI